jgi:hypothetical protein
MVSRMGWRRRKNRKSSNKTQQEKLSASLACLNPPALERRLRKLDEFIAESPSVISQWQADRARVLIAAQEEFAVLCERWCRVLRMCQELPQPQNSIVSFCDKAHIRWHANATFFGRLFGQKYRDQLMTSLSHSLPDLRKSNAETLELLWNNVKDSPLCSRNDVANLHDELRRLMQSAHDFRVQSFHEFVTLVESSEPLGHGKWLRSWDEWKAAWAVSLQIISESEVDESIKKKWKRNPEYGPTYDPWELELQCNPTRELYGRLLHDGAFQAALDERQMVVQALERALQKAEQEASELRKKHGFSDKTIAAAAAFFDQTKKLAEKLRNEMLEDLSNQSDCPYCMGPLGDVPHLDHILPTSHGGLSKRDNLVFACSICNLKKSDLTLLEFTEFIGFDFKQVVLRLRAMGKRV